MFNLNTVVIRDIVYLWQTNVLYVNTSSDLKTHKLFKILATAAGQLYRIHTVFWFGLVSIFFWYCSQKGGFCEQYQNNTATKPGWNAFMTKHVFDLHQFLFSLFFKNGCAY